jgi:hypothetical protein
MKYLALLLLLTISCPGVMARDKEVPRDSTSISVRSFDAAAIERYKQDPKFQYDKLAEPVSSLWQRIWRAFWDWVDQITSTRAGRITLRTVLIAVGIAILVFFIWKLFGDRTKLFGGKGSKGLDYEIGEENIHSISFDEAIREALSSGNYRLAVRLVYLQSLKLLSDRSLIAWNPGKTNSAYVQELRAHPSHNAFRELTLAFESAWYGGIPVSKAHFEELDAAFIDFKTKIA